MYLLNNHIHAVLICAMLTQGKINTIEVQYGIIIIMMCKCMQKPGPSKHLHDCEHIS